MIRRAWSKYTQGSSRYAMLHAKEEGAPEKKLGVRELKKLKKKEREGEHPEEGAVWFILLRHCRHTYICSTSYILLERVI